MVKTTAKQQQKQLRESRQLIEKQILADSPRYIWTKRLCHLGTFILSIGLSILFALKASDVNKSMLVLITIPPISYLFFIMQAYIFILGPYRKRIILRQWKHYYRG